MKLSGVLQKLGDGLVTITHYPEADKYKLVMKNACDVVMINHEITKNMALFRYFVYKHFCYY